MTPEVAFLKAEIARRDAELATVVRQLGDARRAMLELEEGVRSLEGGDHEAGHDTREWGGGEIEAVSVVGTDPDMPLEELDSDEPATRKELFPEGELPQTQAGGGVGPDSDALRDERDRLRAERDNLLDRAVRDEGRVGSLERDLAEARSDRAGMAAERDEAARLLVALRAYLRDREAAEADAASDREQARGALARLEAERDALADERDRLRLDALGASADREDLAASRTERDTLRADLDRARREHAALLAEGRRGDEGRAADRVEAEARLDAIRETLRGVEAERDVVRARLVTLEVGRSGIETEKSALVRDLDAAESTRLDLARRLAEVEEVRDRLGEALATADRRLSESSANLRVQAERADRAISERDASRARAEVLEREIAEAKAPSSAVASPDTLDPTELDRVIRERDQARRDLARLRAILDRHGAADPSPG